MTFLQIYALFGMATAAWFFAHMRNWARMGDSEIGAPPYLGTLKLIWMLPIAAMVWPVAAWALWRDQGLA